MVRFAVIFALGFLSLSTAFCQSAAPQGATSTPLQAAQEPQKGPPPIFIRDERFQKMLELAVLPEKDLEDSVSKALDAQKMSDDQKAKFVEHVKRFRSRIRTEALDSAKSLGLKLSPEKESLFIKSFWQKRIALEKKLNEEVEPRRKLMMSKANEDLQKEFGSVAAGKP